MFIVLCALRCLHANVAYWYICVREIPRSDISKILGAFNVGEVPFFIAGLKKMMVCGVITTPMQNSLPYNVEGSVGG